MVPAQLTGGIQEVCSLFQSQPWLAFNLPLCQGVPEPDLFCWFYSAQGPAVGRRTLQLRAIFQLQCISYTVLSWLRRCLGLHVVFRTVREHQWHCQSLVELVCGAPPKWDAHRTAVWPWGAGRCGWSNTSDEYEETFAIWQYRHSYPALPLMLTNRERRQTEPHPAYKDQLRSSVLKNLKVALEVLLVQAQAAWSLDHKLAGYCLLEFE